MAGAFITFEGIDGCGKSTQLRLLASELRVRGLDIVTTREPGGTSLGQKLRAALLDVQEQVDPLTELLVFAADRAQHVRKHLSPALAANRVVLSDRYADATVAYQGAGRGFDEKLIKQIVELATGGLKPDLTLITLPFAWLVMFSRLIGNTEVKESLRRTLETNRFARSLLFTGDEGIGKKAFALEVAKALNCRNRQGVEACDECPSCKRISR